MYEKNPLKNVVAMLLLLFSVSTFAAELPDPEVLAKQYLKDLCTLNEQDFTRKYMLTQTDAVDLINLLNKLSVEYNEPFSNEVTDSLAIRSQVHSLVVKSYKSFKKWQWKNNIDSSKIKYHSCEFELEKKRKIPFYTLEDMKIYFSCDTTNYSFSCDDFLNLKTKWIGGDFDGIYKVDKYFNEVYDDYAYDYGYDYETMVADTMAVAVDTAYAYNEAGEYYEESEYVYDQQPLTKKQLKIQKKIDAYNRKIDALYIKQYE